MKSASRRIAIKALAGLALASAWTLVYAAQVAGTVVNLSGALLAQKGDGTVKVLVLKSEVEQGDTLVSQKNTYAQIRFIDNSEITLKPNTTFKIEAFAYDETSPQSDSASFKLVKGGLRSITGLLGKRNKAKFSLKTPTATIGIRGTTFTAQWLQAPGLAPGLYVAVIDGMINLSNQGGSLDFSAGQFGFTPSMMAPPMLVPSNPALNFAPPPAFDEPLAQDNGPLKSPDMIDCEVR